MRILLLGTVMLACFGLASPKAGHAISLPPTGGGNTNHTQLGSWNFTDTNTWLSSSGRVPLGFTNLDVSYIGDNTALLLDNPNPAYLRYNIFEDDSSMNLDLATGSLTFWFAPTWSGTSQGGTGPGTWGRLIEVGSYTTNASYGWWSLYLDDGGNNIYFSVQSDTGDQATILTAPVAWTTNRWHNIALTYCGTNTALYLDGVLATNGPGLTFLPGADAVAAGFGIGSDMSSGLLQARGMFDDVHTYNAVLPENTAFGMFNILQIVFYGNPENFANFSSAPITQSPTPTFNAITGSGYLTNLGPTATCISSTNVWFTNTSCVVTPSKGITLTFSIAGGTNGALYDVFATAALKSPITNAQWAWMGQGYSCHTYAITNLPTTGGAYLMLGTPQDTDQDGLTDAFELLVSHTDPRNPDTDGDGISDGDEVAIYHTDPRVSNPAIPAGSLNIQPCPQ